MAGGTEVESLTRRNASGSFVFSYVTILVGFDQTLKFLSLFILRNSTARLTNLVLLSYLWFSHSVGAGMVLPECLSLSASYRLSWWWLLIQAEFSDI